MWQGLLTKKKLIELLTDVPDDVMINVLNEDGESSANVEFWFEDLETRKFVSITGLEPLWKMSLEEKRKIMEGS